MGTKVSYVKGGTLIQCSTSSLPRPRPKLAWPIPSFPATGQSFLQLTLQAIGGSGTSAVLVTTPAALPGNSVPPMAFMIVGGSAATWTLFWTSYQGSPPASLAWNSVPVPSAGLGSGLLLTPPNNSVVLCYLQRVEAGQTYTYTQVSITTPLDPTQGTITGIQTTLAMMASDGILSVSEKPAAIADYTGLSGQVTALRAQATAIGATLPTANTLLAYLTSLGSYSWNDTAAGHDTVIPVPATWTSKWNEIYGEVAALNANIAAKLNTGVVAAGGSAAWGGITGASAQASPVGGWSTAAVFNPTIVAGVAYALKVAGASGAARDIFIAGQAGYSNGFTVQFDGTKMVYIFGDPAGTTSFTGFVSTGALTADSLRARTGGALYLNNPTNTGAVTINFTSGNVCAFDSAVSMGALTATSLTGNAGSIFDICAPSSFGVRIGRNSGTGGFNVVAGGTATSNFFVDDAGNITATRGITALGALTASTGNFSGIVTANGGVFLNKNTGSAGAILFYSQGYTAWQNYMAPASTASQGFAANITPPAGSYVTSWSLRSFIENISGYGWTWESGSSVSTAPSLIAELSSNTGNFRTIGSLATDSGRLALGTAASPTVDGVTRYLWRSGNFLLWRYDGTNDSQIITLNALGGTFAGVQALQAMLNAPTPGTWATYGALPTAGTLNTDPFPPGCYIYSSVIVDTAGDGTAGTLYKNVAGTWTRVGSGNAIYGKITAANLSVGSVGAIAIASHSITAAEINATSVSTAILTAGSITTSMMTAGTINADRLTAGSITATQINASSISAAILTAGAITTAMMTAGTINADRLTAGSITTALMTAGTINADRLTANSITATQINASSISAAILTANSITAAMLQATLTMSTVITSTSYTAGTGSAAPIGFKLSGPAFTTTYIGGATDPTCQMEIGGSVNIAGTPAQTFSDRLMSLGSHTYTTPGTYSFPVPNGVTRLLCTVTAGGGTGGAGTTATGGGGGGGGGSTGQVTLIVVPGATITVVVGVGSGSGGNGGNSSVTSATGDSLVCTGGAVGASGSTRLGGLSGFPSYNLRTIILAQSGGISAGNGGNSLEAMSFGLAWGQTGGGGGGGTGGAGYGNNAAWLASSAGSGNGSGGGGGCSFYGKGGIGGNGVTPTVGSAPNAGAYGAGGGGGGCSGSTSSAGGLGLSGCVVLAWGFGY